MSTVNIRTYGAVGDGTTDDTAAIAAALEAVSGVVHFPTGTYRTTAPLVVNPHRVSIRGDGPQCSVFTPQLAAGQYALTIGWDGGAETADRPGPYDAISGVGLVGTVGAGQPNCIRIAGQGTYPHASGLTLRDVSIKGFGVQVDLGPQAYLIGFDRVYFHSAQSYGVRMDDVANAGENIAFTGCCWSGGPGTGVYVNTSGAAFYFSHCSFDYLARALWQRGGVVNFNACHFETSTQYGGPGKELLRLDRNGLVSRPIMRLTDCDFYDAWDNYDCAIRLVGDNGDQGLRVINPYVRLSATCCPYLIRDDGPWPSSVVVSGAWYGRGDFPAPKMRKQNGTDLVLTPGVTHVV